MGNHQHPNRRWINWVLYEIGDRYLRKYRPHLRGVIYDLGCGEQPHKSFFLEHGERYVGVDWWGGNGQHRPDIISDLNQPLEIPSQAADSVVSLSVLEHLCEPQVMLNEAFRILKPGGAIVLQVPWQWWIHEAPHDYFRYTPFALRYMLGKAGFELIEVEAQCGFFTMWIVKFNYFTNRAITGPMPVRRFFKMFLVPVWYLGQVLAPYLDRLDKNWELETQGYFVLAFKPKTDEPQD